MATISQVLVTLAVDPFIIFLTNICSTYRHTGGRNASSSASSSYASSSRQQQQQQQQQQTSLSMAGVPAGVYYVNPQTIQSTGAAGTGQQFVMLTPRLPSGVNFAPSSSVQYANSSSTQSESSMTAIPVSMPISYNAIPGAVQPVAYIVPGVQAAGGGPGLLPVPYATYPGPGAPGTMTLPANPFPSTFSSVSYDPSCLTSYPEYRLLTCSSPAQAMTHVPAGATAAQVPVTGSSFTKQSPSPTSQQQQQQQQQAPPTSDPTPPPHLVAQGNPQYYSGYTLCAPPSNLPPGAMVTTPLAVNQFCQMGPPPSHQHTHYPQHQFHQPRSRNPHHSGSKNHFRSS